MVKQFEINAYVYTYTELSLLVYKGDLGYIKLLIFLALLLCHFDLILKNAIILIIVYFLECFHLLNEGIFSNLSSQSHTPWAESPSEHQSSLFFSWYTVSNTPWHLNFS